MIRKQREVGLDTLSFEHALKHVLRQDPDVIVIGEMRDAAVSARACPDQLRAVNFADWIVLKNVFDGVFTVIRVDMLDNQSVIEQREVGLDTLSFQHALKHVLREDPDIIMLGEMRDATSVAAAMSAADTGHLVLSTVHTTNAGQSVGRILDFFKADEREQVRRQLAGTLQAVVCQRMVPTIAGGMTPALEIMMNSSTVKKMIEENRLDKLGAAIETGGEDGSQSFNQALFELVKDGKVSQKEALAKASNAQALEMNFKGIFLSEGNRILG